MQVGSAPRTPRSGSLEAPACGRCLQGKYQGIKGSVFWLDCDGVGHSAAWALAVSKTGGGRNTPAICLDQHRHRWILGNSKNGGERLGEKHPTVKYPRGVAYSTNVFGVFVRNVLRRGFSSYKIAGRRHGSGASARVHSAHWFPVDGGRDRQPSV